MIIEIPEWFLYVVAVYAVLYAVDTALALYTAYLDYKLNKHRGE